MKNTKIDWCNSTVNPIMGCPNNCEYCYARKINKRFKYIEDWCKPQFFPKRLKDFYSKKPKSIFIDSMSDIGTWEQYWFNSVMDAINANPQHRYIALTKRYARYCELARRANVGVIKNLYIGMSVTTQAQLEKATDQVDFYSIEPLLEPLDIPFEMNLPRTLIIGAETGNRKGKVIPKKEWIDEIVKCADERNCIVFMKESLRKIMGDDFRQDKLLWEIER
ncbi:MAG: DUF5131 family protein [Eubacterium sp.]|nr:DUF5131 family protein [Eubacterium sp.]